MTRVFLIAAISAIVSSPASEGRQDGEVSLEEKLLATLPEGAECLWASFSTDGKSVIYLAAQGEKRFVVVGEKRSPMYDETRGFKVSGDGRTVCYLATRESRWFAVVDGKEHGGSER